MMKKKLRRTMGAPKSYAQIDQDAQMNLANEMKEKQPKQLIRQSIFQHKNWSTKEKVKLMVFLAYYHALPDWISQRRSIHLYKHLSNFLKKARTPEQCKNIHSLLKRKFTTLDVVIEAMQEELQAEQNYDKLLTKYEKDIVSFENSNRLFDNLVQDTKYQPLRNRKTERQETNLRMNNEYSLKEDFGALKAQKTRQGRVQQTQHKQIVKKQQQVVTQFTIRRDEILRNCNHYFSQWLFYTNLYEKLYKPAPTTPQN